MKEQYSTKELQTFVFLARSASFTVAADTLHVTQSALSKRIAELEQKLGVRLFDRTTRQLHLTVEGREFLEMAESLLDHIERSITDLRLIAKGKRGRLWMAAAPHMSSTLMPPVLAAFHRSNPSVDISYYDCHRTEMLRHVLAGSAEFGVIGGLVGQDHAFPAEFKITPVIQREEHLSVGFAAGHPLEKLEIVRWNDLLPYKTVMLRATGGLGHMYRLLSQHIQVALPTTIEVSMISTAIGMAAAGLGIVVFPAYVIENVGNSGIRQRFIDEGPLQYQFSFVHHYNRSLSGVALSFADELVGHLSKRPSAVT